MDRKNDNELFVMLELAKLTCYVLEHGKGIPTKFDFIYWISILIRQEK